MLKQLRNKKINSFLGFAILLVLALSVSFAAAANTGGSSIIADQAGMPGSNITGLLHRGAAEQSVRKFTVGTTNLNTEFQAVAPSNQHSEFAGFPDNGVSKFITLFNAFFPARLFVGNMSAGLPNYWLTATNGVSVALQRVNIKGNLLATNLNTNAGNATGEDSVCVDAYGRVKLCDLPDYHWEIGDYGSCSDGSASTCSGSYTTTSGGSCSGSWDTAGAGSCSGTYQTTSGGSCSGSFGFNDDPGYGCSGPCGQCQQESCYGSTESACLGSGSDSNCSPSANCSWSAGSTTNNSCAGLTQTQCGSQQYDGCDWASNSTTNSCTGAGTDSACTSLNSACNWNASSTTNSCTGATTSSACTGQNSACTFTAAGTSVKTRTVTCQDGSGNIVSDSLCSQPKPDTETADGCNGATYSWDTGDWGSCTASGAGSCSGNYTTSGAGSCSGNYQTTTGPWTSTYNGSSCSGEDGGNTQENCETMGGFCHLNKQYTCSGTTTTNSCSGASSSSSCTSQSSSCSWSGGSSTTNSCSGLSETSCNSHGTCAWAGGGTNQVRSVTCRRDSDGVVMSDESLCTPPAKPDENQTGCVTSSNGVCYNAIPNFTPNQCTAGTFSDLSDTSTTAYWECVGTDGGSTASCSSVIYVVDPTVNGVCGDIVTHCTSGIYYNSNTSNMFEWQCQGSNGGSTASCTFDLDIDIDVNIGWMH